MSNENIPEDTGPDAEVKKIQDAIYPANDSSSAPAPNATEPSNSTTAAPLDSANFDSDSISDSDFLADDSLEPSAESPVSHESASWSTDDSAYGLAANSQTRRQTASLPFLETAPQTLRETAQETPQTFAASPSWNGASEKDFSQTSEDAHATQSVETLPSPTAPNDPQSFLPEKVFKWRYSLRDLCDEFFWAFVFILVWFDLLWTSYPANWPYFVYYLILTVLFGIGVVYFSCLHSGTSFLAVAKEKRLAAKYAKKDEVNDAIDSEDLPEKPKRLALSCFRWFQEWYRYWFDLFKFIILILAFIVFLIRGAGCITIYMKCANPTVSEAVEAPANPETSANPETNANAETSSNPETNANAETSANPETNANAETSANPQTNANSEASVTPETNANAETSANPETNANAETSANPQTNANSEASANPETNANVETSASPGPSVNLTNAIPESSANAETSANPGPSADESVPADSETEELPTEIENLPTEIAPSVSTSGSTETTDSAPTNSAQPTNSATSVNAVTNETASSETNRNSAESDSAPKRTLIQGFVNFLRTSLIVSFGLCVWGYALDLILHVLLDRYLTYYKLTPTHIITRSGLFVIVVNKIAIWDVAQVNIKRNLWQRIWKIGTIELRIRDQGLMDDVSDVADAMDNIVILRGLKNPEEVKDLINQYRLFIRHLIGRRVLKQIAQ